VLAAAARVLQDAAVHARLEVRGTAVAATELALAADLAQAAAVTRVWPVAGSGAVPADEVEIAVTDGEGAAGLGGLVQLAGACLPSTDDGPRTTPRPAAAAVWPDVLAALDVRAWGPGAAAVTVDTWVLGAGGWVRPPSVSAPGEWEPVDERDLALLLADVLAQCGAAQCGAAQWGAAPWGAAQPSGARCGVPPVGGTGG
jgi:hypothetical protein